MKIKLTYTADSEEVLAEVAFLLENLKSDLHGVDESLNEIIKNLKEINFNADKMFSDTDLTRRRLAKIDLRLLDALGIVAAYKDHQHGHGGAETVTIDMTPEENKDD